MCQSGSDVKAEVEGAVFRVLCDACRGRVGKKLKDTGKTVFDFYPEDYPICKKCINIARSVLHEFARNEFGLELDDLESALTQLPCLGSLLSGVRKLKL
jgi:hypothetical protein